MSSTKNAILKPSSAAAARLRAWRGAPCSAQQHGAAIAFINARSRLRRHHRALCAAYVTRHGKRLIGMARRRGANIAPRRMAPHRAVNMEGKKEGRKGDLLAKDGKKMRKA